MTRRDFLATSAAAALAGSLTRPQLSLAQAGARVQPVFTPIRRNVGCFTMRGGTIGWLVNADAVAVVDSQFPEEARALLAGLGERSGGRSVDWLINTHHHADHTFGNGEFRGVARSVVAHVQAAEHMRDTPGGTRAPVPAEPLYPDTTFTDSWTSDAGDERISARFFGRAHTSGDVVITFERANVAHMGDLMLFRQHAIVDRAAGATIRGWMSVLERTVDTHDADTIYIFGHTTTGHPVTGGGTDLLRARDYFDALLSFVDAQMRGGRSRDEILAMRDPLAGFEEYGRFGQPGPRDALTCAWEELSAEAQTGP